MSLRNSISISVGYGSTDRSLRRADRALRHGGALTCSTIVLSPIQSKLAMLSNTSSRLCRISVRSFTSAARRSLRASQSTGAASNAASSSTPTVATSKFMRQSREDALWTPGLRWRDEEQVDVGRIPEDSPAVAETDLRSVEEGGRETAKMKSVP